MTLAAGCWERRARPTRGRPDSEESALTANVRTTQPVSVESTEPDSVESTDGSAVTAPPPTSAYVRISWGPELPADAAAALLREFTGAGQLPPTYRTVLLAKSTTGHEALVFFGQRPTDGQASDLGDDVGQVLRAAGATNVQVGSSAFDITMVDPNARMIWVPVQS
jgi:hypothetical protein